MWWQEPLLSDILLALNELSVNIRAMSMMTVCACPVSTLTPDALPVFSPSSCSSLFPSQTVPCYFHVTSICPQSERFHSVKLDCEFQTPPFLPDWVVLTGYLKV